ncbi:exosome complex exonuclease RRP46 homolog isoform X3 [Spinacia oleracea]|uniref:Exosome complex exonuclease RRP46 homolog isoform X3 n=1 Tax=Spinacia oleracea TaxID=3562 RepID=A0A9R0JHQ5_SPIOL|nr:exosome complex exonuclease RRP46 homolog isoform X3 [Spinacia oleracea]
MEVDREDGRTATMLRPLACSRSVLNRAHGSASWSQGDTKVLAAVYGPKVGTKKTENPEKASIEVIWKPKTGQIGKVVNDDGALLPCAINAACAALVDAGISLKHLAVAICCCLAETGCVILDPTKQEEQKMKASVYLVFPNSVLSVLQVSVTKIDEPMEHGIITSVTHGAMSVEDYFYCLKSGRAATAKLSNFLRSRLQNRLPSDLLGDT